MCQTSLTHVRCAEHHKIVLTEEGTTDEAVLLSGLSWLEGCCCMLPSSYGASQEEGIESTGVGSCNKGSSVV